MNADYEWNIGAFIFNNNLINKEINEDHVKINSALFNDIQARLPFTLVPRFNFTE